MTIPEFMWELFLGVYCTIWGFKRDAPILAAGAPNLSGTAPSRPGSASVLAGSAG